MKNLIYLVLVVLFFSCQSGSKNNQETKSADTQQVVLVETTVNIGGMHCDNCVKSVEKGITELAGISNVVVSLSDSTAVVKFDEFKVKKEDIQKAIEGKGFTVKSTL